MLDYFFSEITIYNIQRTVTKKTGKQELWILHSACCLMVLYICVNFSKNIWNGFYVTDGYVHIMVITINNIQRAVTPK